MKITNVSVQWFNGDGTRAGAERTTLAEIQARLGDALHTPPSDWWPNPQLIAIARLATGEVARVYAR